MAIKKIKNIKAEKVNVLFDNFNNNITANMHEKIALQTSSNFDILRFKNKEIKDSNEDT